MIPLSKVDQFIDKLTAPVDTNVADSGGNNGRAETIDQYIERMVRVKKKVKLNGHVNGKGHA